eukprot:5937317-Pleurochrysis_carterae.AAC.1
MPMSRWETACSTREGRSGCAGAWLTWESDGMPCGAWAARSCWMYEFWRSTTSLPSIVMSTLRRSDTSPSSSTRQ